MVMLELSVDVDGHGLVLSAVSSAHACRVVGQLTMAMVAVLLVVSSCGLPSCLWVVATCHCC